MIDINACFYKSREGDEIATEKLTKVFYRICDKFVQRFGITGEPLDIRQELMIYFTKALQQYNPAKEIPPYQWLTYCLKRGAYTLKRDTERKKEKAKRESLSLNVRVFSDDEQEYIDILPCPGNNYPDIEKINDNEEFADKYKPFAKKLSDLELRVLWMRIDGYKYEKIAEELNVSEKAVDNAMMRIRKKATRYGFNPQRERG